MSFDRPEMWWLAALALPIVLLHLHHRRRVAVDVSSLEPWRDLVAAGVGRGAVRRVSDVVALACLLVALVAFAAAAAGPVTGEIASDPLRLAIVVDASAAMNGGAAPGRTRFAQAVEWAAARLDALAPQDEATVWLATDEPTVLAGPSTDKAAVRAALRAAQPTLRPSGVVATTRLALRAARGIGKLGADVLVLTTAAGETELTVAQVEPPSRVGLHVAVVPADGRFDVRVADARLDPADPTSVVVTTTTNESTIVSPVDANVVVTCDGEPLERSSGGSLGRSAEKRFVLGRHAATGGIVEARLEGENVFAEQAAMRFSLPAKRPLAVAVVSAKPSPFLVEALRAMPDVVDAARTTLVAPGASPDAFAGADVVIADGATPPAGVPSLTFAAEGVRAVARPLLWSVGAHPVLAGADLSPLRIERAAIVDAAPEDATIVAAAEGAVGVAGERGGRRFVTFGFRPDASTLPLEAAFPLLVRNSLRWLAKTPPVPPFVVAGEPLPGEAGERGETAPYPPPGGPYDLDVTIGGVACRTVVRWVPPKDFAIASERPAGAPDAASVLASLSDRHLDHDTRVRHAAWLAAVGAASLVAGAALLRPRRRATAAPPATGTAIPNATRPAERARAA